MYCSRCDQQGSIYKARIEATDEMVYICDECEGLWKDPSKISEYKTSIYGKDFFDLTTFRGQQLVYMASKIENLGYDWDK